MKNITVAVDDETYRLSCAKAEKRGTSVVELVRSYLVSLAEDENAEAEFERLRAVQDETLREIRARGEEFRAADNLPREALYERDKLSA